MIRIGSFKTRDRGQKPCPDCGHVYNNATIPPICQCGFLLDGSYDPGEKVKKPPTDAQLIVDGLVSVRQNLRGANLRIFVNLTENKVHTFCM